MLSIAVLVTLVVIVVVWARRSRDRYRRELAGEIAPLAAFAEDKRLGFRRLDDPGVFELTIPVTDGCVVMRGYRQRDRGTRLRGVVRHTELVFEREHRHAPEHRHARSRGAEGACEFGARGPLVLCVPSGELDRIGVRAPDDRIGRLLLVEPVLGREAARAVAVRAGLLRRVSEGTAHGFTVWSDLDTAPEQGRAAAAVSEACRMIGEVVGVPAAALVTLSPDGRAVGGIIARVPEFVADTERLERLQEALERMRAPEDGLD